MGLIGLIIGAVVASKMLNGGDNEEDEVLSEADDAIRKYYDTYLNNMYIREGRKLNSDSEHYLDPGGFIFKNEDYRPDYPRIKLYYVDKEDESPTPYPPEGAMDLDELFDKYNSADYYSAYGRYLCAEHEFLAQLPIKVRQNCSNYVRNRISYLIDDYEKIMRYNREHENRY